MSRAPMAGSARPSGEGRQGASAPQAAGTPQAVTVAPQAVTVARGWFGASALRWDPAGSLPQREGEGPGQTALAARGVLAAFPLLLPCEGGGGGSAPSPAGACWGGVGLRKQLRAAPLLPPVSARGGPAWPQRACSGGQARVEGGAWEESGPVVARHVPGGRRCPQGHGAALAAGCRRGPSSPARLPAGAGPVLLPQPCRRGKGEEEKHLPGCPPRLGRGGILAAVGSCRGTGAGDCEDSKRRGAQARSRTSAARW